MDKTYKNKEFGFSIKYPNDWKLVTDQENKTKRGVPFLYVFHSDFIEQYKEGEGMGPNLNIGYFELKLHHPEKDFWLQRDELLQTLPAFFFRGGEI